MTEPEKILKKLGLFALGVLAAIYVGRQFVSLINEQLKYETALTVTSEESIEAEAYIMRDELVLTSNYSGIMLASTDDGGRISKDKEAVKVYSRENDVSVESSIRAIDEKINVLEKSIVDSAATSDLTKMDEEIDAMLDSVVVFTANNDLVGALSNKDDILVQMNKRWQISNPGKNFDVKIAGLLSERTALKSKLSGNAVSVFAPESGYYFGSVDGYESIFSSQKISGLTLDEFENMCSSEPMQYSSNVAGKIVTDYMWYIACPVSAEQSAYFDIGNRYSVEFVYSYGTVIDMQLHSKVEENGRNDAILIFSTSYMPEDFEYTRNQQVKIIYKQYSGLKIPKKAIRFIGDVKGVYVIAGTEVEFKMANEIYGVDDFYIIDPNAENYPTVKRIPDANSDGMSESVKDEPADEAGTSYYRILSLYDQVITGGKDVYDGMKID